MKPGGLHGGEGTVPFWVLVTDWNLGLSSSLLLGTRGRDHPPSTSFLGPLLLRSLRGQPPPPWMEPGPSTFPRIRRATLASIPAEPRTRQDVQRTLICLCSVSEVELPSSQGVWPCSPSPVRRVCVGALEAGQGPHGFGYWV